MRAISPEFEGIKIKRLTQDNCNSCQMASILSEISKQEDAILTRGKSFYRKLILDSNIWILILESTGRIVGTLGITQLSEKAVELSSGWIIQELRGEGLYGTLKKMVLMEVTNKIVISTCKSEGVIGRRVSATNFSYGLKPKKFSWLRDIDPDAFNKCCCCGPKRNATYCDIRDVKCKLNVKTDAVVKVLI